jgi:hypothetical protein
MIFKFKKILLTTFLAATLLIHPQIACAQFEGKVSSNEDVAMAFFKTGNTKPDFELWARNTKNYKVQPPTHALRYIEDEKQRLIKAWQKYDPESNTIILQTKVRLHDHQCDLLEGAVGCISVNGSYRSGVAGVHGAQERIGLFSPQLTKQNPIRAKTQRGFQKALNCYFRNTLFAFGSKQRNMVFMDGFDFGRIFNRDDPFFGINLFQNGVQEGRFPC